jgi:hypothetical protein
MVHVSGVGSNQGENAMRTTDPSKTNSAKCKHRADRYFGSSNNLELSVAIINRVSLHEAQNIWPRKRVCVKKSGSIKMPEKKLDGGARRSSNLAAAHYLHVRRRDVSTTTSRAD